MLDPAQLTGPGFVTETGHRVQVQVPEPDSARVLTAVLEHDALRYGDYDQVAFCTSPGIQQFRSLPGGVNAGTDMAVQVPCVELSFLTPADPETLNHILTAIYAAHPYEEPVIHVLPALRTLHDRGFDDQNPNRFWNRDDANWVPAAHRRGAATDHG